jgi:hypothetical protein
MTTRYRCLSSDGSLLAPLHTSGTGRPPAKCRYCGGLLVTEHGDWGVFRWNPENRYPREKAVRVYARKSAAQRYADRDDSRALVVRWIPAYSQDSASTLGGAGR